MNNSVLRHRDWTAQGGVINKGVATTTGDFDNETMNQGAIETKYTYCQLPTTFLVKIRKLNT